MVLPCRGKDSGLLDWSLPAIRKCSQDAVGLGSVFLWKLAEVRRRVGATHIECSGTPRVWYRVVVSPRRTFCNVLIGLLILRRERFQFS